MRRHAEAARAAGGTVVFVPTMGYLHEGHLTLVREGKKHGGHVVVSIFVNPTQFAPGEDLDKYPRNEEGDLALLSAEGVDAVFLPPAGSMYEEGHETRVILEKLPHHLCGLSRPGHFTGVATVVAKLFHLVMPHVAVFGQKDFQQLAVIRRMVRDLDFPIRIVGVPTVREADGLAMSSRNSYLTPSQRAFAPALYRALSLAREMVRQGETRPAAILEKALSPIWENAEARVDYAMIVDPDTLEGLAEIRGPTLMALAVFVGKTRLIDNLILSD